MRDVRIVIVQALHFLIERKAELPDLRTISLKIVGNDELCDRLGRRPIELAVKIAGNDVHALKKILAESLQIGSLGGRLRLTETGVRRGEMAVQVGQFAI